MQKDIRTVFQSLHRMEGEKYVSPRIWTLDWNTHKVLQPKVQKNFSLSTGRPAGSMMPSGNAEAKGNHLLPSGHSDTWNRSRGGQIPEGLIWGHISSNGDW
jgi:hypothetical protein